MGNSLLFSFSNLLSKTEPSYILFCSMELEETSAVIRAQAESLLVEKGIASLLQSTGTLHFAGSYALNLMTWRDLDLQLDPKEGLDPTAIYMFLLSALSADPQLHEAKFFRFLGDYKPHYLRGHAFQFVFDTPSLGGIWKLDVWVLPSAEIESNQSYLAQLNERLTPETRALILKLKTELMQATGQVPKGGSRHLYEAVLMENLRDRAAIFDYLKRHKVPL